MATKFNLTRKQQEIYDFLLNQDIFDHSPTLDELCSAVGLKSRGSLHKHIQALVDAGLVEPANKKQRGIRVIHPSRNPQPNELPLLGYIAAGQPIEAIETPQSITVPEQLTGGASCFVLEVKGDSMIDDGIFDGDWVVIEQRATAQKGEIVVALIDSHEATLKHIEQRPGEIVLHPANSTLKPMRYTPDRVRIQGVLVGQMRSYRRF